MKSCRKCKKYLSCTKLCSEVRSYVDQDFTPNRELTIDPVQLENYEVGGKCWFGTTKTNTKLIYELYFLDKLPPRIISNHINLSIRHIFRIIKELKTTIPDDNLVSSKILRMHFLEYIPFRAIANELSTPITYVYKCVTRHIFKVASGK